MNAASVLIHDTDMNNNDNSSMNWNDANLLKTDNETTFQVKGDFKPLRFTIIVPHLTENEIHGLINKKSNQIITES